MLSRVFPSAFDNRLQGHWSALAILWVITAFKAIMAWNSAINTYYGAAVADRIPIDSYPPEAARTVLSIFAKLGNLHAILVALSLLALLRYRAMVPLIYVVLIYEYLSRKVLSHHWDGVPLFGWPGSTAGLIVSGLFVAMLIGFVLSIAARRDSGGLAD